MDLVLNELSFSPVRERALIDLKTGRDVVDSASVVFPWLSFCDTAIEQLGALNGVEPEFGSIIRHLSALNHQTKGWTGGDFLSGYPFKCSPESESTMQKYSAERQFACPDGTVRQFELHSKININARRIYFLVGRPNERTLIGYVGPHLRVSTEG